MHNILNDHRKSLMDQHYMFTEVSQEPYSGLLFPEQDGEIIMTLGSGFQIHLYSTHGAYFAEHGLLITED